MEGGLTNSSFSIFGNSDNICPNSWLQPSPSPLTPGADNYFFLDHQENSSSSHQNLFKSITVANQTQFLGFPPRLGVGNEYIKGFSDHSIFRQETGFVDGLIHLDHENGENYLDWSPVNGAKEKKSGSSSTPWIKGQWTLEEDRKLIELVERYGYRKWAMVAQHMAGRIGKQCRERWQNHLRPDIKKDHHWSEEEERLLIDAHQRVGNKWAEIAKYIPGRTENSIKNHWNATKRKQTSKRKIKKPAALNGIKQSVLLEEYIQNKYFNKGSNSNSGNSPVVHLNDQNAPPSPSVDDAPISFSTYEDYEEEMNFMTNLFGNKDNNMADSRKNSIGNNSVSSCLTSVSQIHKGSMGNNYLSSSSSRPNMEQNDVTIGIPRDEGTNVILYPEFYFGSSMFDGSPGLA